MTARKPLRLYALCGEQHGRFGMLRMGRYQLPQIHTTRKSALDEKRHGFRSTYPAMQSAVVVTFVEQMPAKRKRKS